MDVYVGLETCTFFSTAQPKPSVAQTHHVVLPSDDSEVSTELQCDIQPGALAQRYSVQWRRLCQNENFSDVPMNAELFNLTLNVTSGLNGSQYQCEVTINHDGSLSRTYNGSRNTILISSKTFTSDTLQGTWWWSLVALQYHTWLLFATRECQEIPIPYLVSGKYMYLLTLHLLIDLQTIRL